MKVNTQTERKYTVYALSIQTLLILYHTLSRFLNKSILLLVDGSNNNAGGVSNIVDPDQTPRSAASDQGLHCLHRPVCKYT